MHEDDRYNFLSVWFENVTETFTKFPYIVFNTVIDFGLVEPPHITSHSPHLHIRFGSAHVSLEGGIRKFGVPACKREDSKRALLHETYVDNIGIIATDADHLEAIRADIVSALSIYNLNCDKFYAPRSETHLPVASSSVMYGILWNMEDDTIKPRTKLNIWGFKRGAAQGEDLAETNFEGLLITRRRHARLLASLYDSLGSFYGPLLSQAKLLMKQMVKITPKDNLDANLRDFSVALDDTVRNFWFGLKDIQEKINFRSRSAIPKGNTLQHILAIHDAGAHMLGTVIYLVSKNKDTGELVSNVFSSKSSLRTASIPKNEKASILQSAALSLQVVTALKDTINEAENVTLLLMGDSTISSHMFSSTYVGDSESKNIATKTDAILTCMAKFAPKMSIELGWLSGQSLTPADTLTKPFTGDLISFINGNVWRHGYKFYSDIEHLQKFIYYRWIKDTGHYTALPEYLRKCQDPLRAETVLLAGLPAPSTSELCQLNCDCPVPDGPSAPRPPCAQLAVALYGNLIQQEVFEVSGQLASPEFTKKALATIFIGTSATKHQAYNMSMVTLRSGHQYVPPTGIRKPKQEDTKTADSLDNIPAGFHVGHTKIEATDRLKYSDQTSGQATVRDHTTEARARAQRRRDKMEKYYTGNNPGETFQHVLRLSPLCYQEKPLLPTNTESLPHLENFRTEESYLEALHRHEHLHSSLNVHSQEMAFVLGAKRMNYTTKQIFQATWLKFLKSDQLFYKIKPGMGQLNEELNLVFNKYIAEDEEAAASLGSSNCPMLSPSGPLMVKILQSCHKEKHETCCWATHHSQQSTLVLATRRFFSATTPNLKKTCKSVLAECVGCLRGKSKYYKAVVGPRMAGTDPTAPIFSTCSFDELGQISVSAFRGSKKIIKIYVILFACVFSGSVICVVTDSLKPQGIRRAIQHMKLRTGCEIKQLIGDAFSSHSPRLLDPNEKIEGVKILDPKSQHANYAERKISCFKKIWYRGIRSMRGEARSFGSWTVFDILYLADLVSASVNLQPLSEDTHLTPSHLLTPAVFQDICQRMNALEVESDLFERKNVDDAIQVWGKMILEERNKSLLRLQDKFEAKYYPVAKGSRTGREAEIDDVVLVSAGTGTKLGRIINISNNKTSAEVRIGKKVVSQAIKNLRVLSFYRRDHM